jgi:hypothetical protein
VKVRVTLVVDVDSEAWSREYGIELANVREDVRNYILTGIQESPQVEARLFASVSLA